MSFRLFKKVQMPGARRAMSGSVLMYVDAKSIERNEADEPFSTLKKAYKRLTSSAPLRDNYESRI
jgi:hypothetical protein